MSRPFYDKNMNVDDMQMQIYALLATYIDEAGKCIFMKNAQGLCDMLMVIFPCVHTRINEEVRDDIKRDLFNIRDHLAGEELEQEDLTVVMDELYELYLKLQEVLQKEGITLKIRSDPGSIVAR